MGLIKRDCDFCSGEYMAEERDLKRGWGKCCSKACAASNREKNKQKPSSDQTKINYTESVVSNIRERFEPEKLIGKNISLKPWGEKKPCIFFQIDSILVSSFDKSLTPPQHFVTFQITGDYSKHCYNRKFSMYEQVINELMDTGKHIRVECAGEENEDTIEYRILEKTN